MLRNKYINILFYTFEYKGIIFIFTSYILEFSGKILCSPFYFFLIAIEKNNYFDWESNDHRVSGEIL